ncbi:hypothetical protein O3M35_004531 [Rhynocoris fuscipes]|uniref:Uncharacterized protein n=1 Tax=Rhynocoris fuscipes TaxID=488301 RepID=A0AAW1CK59_9HEMI
MEELTHFVSKSFDTRLKTPSSSPTLLETEEPTSPQNLSPQTIDNSVKLVDIDVFSNISNIHRECLE